MTCSAVREPTMVLATVTVRALARGSRLGGLVVAVGTREVRVATSERQVACWRRQMEDPAQRSVALGAVFPAPVGRGVA